MKIKIGLLKRSHGWEQLLTQEGVPWALVGKDLPAGSEEFSVLVVNRPIGSDEVRSLERYLGAGGALLGAARYLEGVAGVSTRQAWLGFLTADRHGLFSEVALLDVEQEGHIPREATLLRSQKGEFCAFAGLFHGGAAVLLPFDPATLLLDGRSAVKSFHAGRDRLPSERVSVVSKAELRHVIHRALEYLHHVRGSPYAHLWWYPADSMNITGIRIDTDGATRAEIDDLYDMAREMEVGFTWFVDVKALSELLPHFATMVGQEIGVHCFEHREYAVRGEAQTDLVKAQAILHSVGLAAEGMAAPYGLWSEALAETQEHLGFFYSSEFSYAYDTLPLLPARDARPYRVWQIPVHPICPGSLRQAGYTDGEMATYFTDVADAKILRRDPLLFYHHPSHHARGVIRGLLRHALEAGCRPLTLGAYAHWWSARASMRPEFDVDGASLGIAMGPSGPVDIWIRISDPEGRETFATPRPTVAFDQQQWTVAPAYLPPLDLRRIREFDPRALLGQIYNAMTRRVR